MTEPGSNLARVLGIWGDLSRSKSMTALVDALAEDVVWQGLLPELVCRGRGEVAAVLGSAGASRLAGITRMSAEEVGDRVILTVEGPSLGPSPATPTGTGPEGGPRTLVLWFSGGSVVHMQSFSTREEALAAAP